MGIDCTRRWLLYELVGHVLSRPVHSTVLPEWRRAKGYARYPSTPIHSTLSTILYCPLSSPVLKLRTSSISYVTNGSYLFAFACHHPRLYEYTSVCACSSARALEVTAVGQIASEGIRIQDGKQTGGLPLQARGNGVVIYR